MNIRWKHIFLGALFMTFCAATGQVHASTITKLANGLTVLAERDKRFPLVSLRLYVHAGSAYESAEQAGISHVLEHMVFKGTNKRPKAALATAVESVGGYINAATSFDYTVYTTDVPAEEWRLGMDVLHDMAFNATLDPKELEPEKEVILSELQRSEDNPGGRIIKHLLSQSLAGTSYERPIIGYKDTINAVTSESLRAYIAQHYQPQSMLLVVCGDVDEKDALQEAEKLFGALKNTQSVTPPTNVHPQPVAGPIITVEKGQWNKVHIGIAFPSIGFSDSRSAALDLFAYMLGGDNSSLLYRDFKYEQKLVDDISVANYSFERLGLFAVTAVLDADNVEPFLEALAARFATLTAADFDAAAYKRGKLNIEDAFYRSKETLAGYTSKLGYMQFFNGGAQGEVNYLQALREVTQESVQSLISDILVPQNMNTVVLLPEAAEINQISVIDAVKRVWNTKPQAQVQTQKAGKGAQEILELPNDCRIILQADNTLPYTALDLVFFGGDSLLSKEDQGLAVLSAEMLTNGSGAMSATAWEDYLGDRASGIDVSAGRSNFAVSARYPERFSGDISALVVQMLNEPSFAEEELEREKDNLISAITMRNDQALGLAFRELFPFLFTNGATSYYHMGQKERVAEFSKADIETFWRTQRAQPWVLSVCGTFDRDAIMALAQKLPVPTVAKSAISAPTWNEKKNELSLTLPDRKQAHRLMLFKTVGVSHKDSVGLKVLNAVLAGQSGLLFRDLRDTHGLGYTVTAFPWQDENTGFLTFYIGTENDKVDAAQEGFSRIIKQLHTTLLPEEDILRGKNSLRGDYYRGHQSLGSRSSEAALLSILGLPLDHERQIIEKAVHVDAKTLQKLAQKYIREDNAYYITVRP